MTKELRLMREDLKQAIAQNVSNNQVIQSALNQKADQQVNNTVNSTIKGNSQLLDSANAQDQVQTKVPLFGRSLTEKFEKKSVQFSDMIDDELSGEALQEVERIVD